MEISLMQYFTNLFFHMLMSNRIYEPNVTDLCRIAEALLYCEHPEQREEDWQDLMNDIDEIYKTTHPHLNTHLAVMEISYFKNVSRGLNQMVEIQNNNGEAREYSTPILYKYLDMVGQRLTKIVMRIASKYHLEIPLGTSMRTSADADRTIEAAGGVPKAKAKGTII